MGFYEIFKNKYKIWIANASGFQYVVVKVVCKKKGPEEHIEIM